MNIQVNTGSQTKGSAGLTSEVRLVIEDKLGRYAGRITRVEVHLKDENSDLKKGGDDKRCQIEVRIAGLKPISVTSYGGTQDQALNGAANKMQRLIATTIGKLDAR